MKRVGGKIFDFFDFEINIYYLAFLNVQRTREQAFFDAFHLW